MKALSCKDAGVDCDYVARGQTDEEVLSKAAEHGKKVHGLKDADFTPDKIQKFRSFIRDEGSQYQPQI